MDENRRGEERFEKRRNQDQLLEYMRVYWPLLVALFFAVSTWAEFRMRVSEVATTVSEVQCVQKLATAQLSVNTTKIAVLETSVGDIKNNTERIINRLDRMNRDR